MPSKLKNLVITKVALVDEGACSEAHIQLYKRKGPDSQEPETTDPNKNNKGGVIKMTYEQILASLPAEQRRVVEDKVSNMKTAETKAEDAMKKAKDEVATVKAELKKMKEASIDPEAREEEVLKSLDPAVRQLVEKSRAQAQAAEEAIKKMRTEQEEKEAIIKAKDFKSLGEETELVSVIKGINKMEEDVQKSLYSILEKAHTAMEEVVLKEKGNSRDDNSANDETQAWNKIEKRAVEIAKSRNMTQAEAITAVIQEEPDLYNTYLNSQM